MQYSILKSYFKLTNLKKKEKKIKRRLALLYLVSTKNSTVATFVDYPTKQILSACHIGHVLKLKKLDRVHRRSAEAHKIYGGELRYVLDRYFFKEAHRVLRRLRRERTKLKLVDKVDNPSFKFLVYFKGQSRHRKTVIKEFTKRFRRENEDEKAADVWNQYTIVYISDITGIPHNGCRSRKVQRTRLKHKPKVFRQSNEKKPII
jgi:ribosomal protein S11